ncbi:cytochrome c oxidase assembly protein [Steroidobacter cummioxidans]|uniref:cytochrome c oxidase assembly protein n=1 Tax=Steroidobacter cummioxidans TaxID=1803913 RepID=UPI000E319B64|nr:cytochrome c oxidase assembly protein [Steroidobacter cummioxidans]
MPPIPYCGTPPFPGELLTRFNLDPVLIGVLLALAVGHRALVRDPRMRTHAFVGWAIAAIALLSPLCALSVSLFSARVAQHMILVLIAAPIIALALPISIPRRGAQWLWSATGLFFVALWFWHMPRPYDATFTSTPLYWLMHITLFGSSILLWRELLHHATEHTTTALVAGLLTSTQMCLLGAMLSLAGHPLFDAHVLTAPSWGLTPLQDQQLGGIIMWVPGILLFLWAMLRSLLRLFGMLERANAA